VVAQIARGHDTKRPNSRQRPRLRVAQTVFAIPIVDALAFVGAGEIEVARKHVARINRLAVARLDVARIVMPITCVAPAGIVIEHTSLPPVEVRLKADATYRQRFSACSACSALIRRAL
jgi:hypothetical protein